MDAAVPGRPGGTAALTTVLGPAHVGGAPRARFDDTMAGRGLVLREYRHEVVAKSPGEVEDALTQAEAAARAGAWVAGFVAYEAAAGLDPALTVKAPALGVPEVPLVWFGVFGGADAKPLPDTATGHGGEGWTLDVDEAAHARGVAAVRASIAAGDVYQCNLTARYRSTQHGDPFDLYRRLAQAQRSAHCAFVDTGQVAVASASPELFFDWTGDTVVTRPMKGTAPRGRLPDEDAEFAAALAASAKDRAENVMIVDLLRNDLGRLARYGSVSVDALCTLEPYESVWQLTSTVSARTMPGTGLVDVFRALFPSGSVTGAPKAAAMNVIDTLEQTPRGVYCGAVGLLAPPGAGPRARFSVAIRTAVVDRCSGLAQYGSGGGIVWDSDAAGEYAELEAKAALLRAGAGDFCLLETMRADAGGSVRHWDRHRSRLLASAARFGFTLCPSSLDDAVVDAAAAVDAPSRLRALVDRWGIVRTEVVPLEEDRGPVLLEVDHVPVDDSGPWLFHKTTRRAPYECRAARHPQADQVVLVNASGQVTETTVANLAVRLDGRWWTPPVESGCLPGVLRGWLLDAGCLTERPITVAELSQAQSLAVVSSLRGWRPAVLRD